MGFLARNAADSGVGIVFLFFFVDFRSFLQDEAQMEVVTFGMGMFNGLDWIGLEGRAWESWRFLVSC